eukprot:10293182-Prorocentrum_lima.AAC.1
MACPGSASNDRQAGRKGYSVPTEQPYGHAFGSDPTTNAKRVDVPADKQRSHEHDGVPVDMQGNYEEARKTSLQANQPRHKLATLGKYWRSSHDH